MSEKRIDVIFLTLLFILGILYTYFTRDLFIGKGVFSGGVFTMLPVFYLGYRKKKHWKKILIATFIFGTLFGFLFEFMQELNKSYTVVSSVFPKVLGVVHLDNIFGHTMMTLLILIFYEHFIERKKNPKISKKITYALFFAISVIVLMLLFFYINSSMLILSYPYFYLGLAAIVPPVYLGISKPSYIKEMSAISIYFFILFLTAEIFAVRYNWWIYTGNNYIGSVSIFNTSFPFEELFFWTIMYAPAIVSYYVLFVNDD